MLITYIFLATVGILFATLRPSKYANMVTSSLFVLILLLFTGYLDIASLWSILIGEDVFAPWKVLIIFFTVAYCAVSTDVTGLFETISYKIIHIAKGNTKNLFLFFYLFACVLTIFTSNDIVILTLTPIIFYLGKYSNIPILPFLIAEFFAANTMSMLFLIGNPTNIIITQSLGIGFLEYLKVMFIPTCVAAVSNYALLSFIFRKKLYGTYTLTQQKNPQLKNLQDTRMSIFLILAMMFALAFSDILGIKLWIITSTFFLLFFIKDVVGGKTRGDICTIFQRMPFAVAPFVITFFVLISLFQQTHVYQNLLVLLNSYSGNSIFDIWGYGFLSFLTANLINNQPMSILFSQIFLDLQVGSAGMYYAAIISSNLGANFSLIGALAGLMWVKILRDKGYVIHFTTFMKYGIYITFFTLNITFLALYFVMR